jgi:hypothetical protein
MTYICPVVNFFLLLYLFSEKQNMVQIYYATSLEEEKKNKEKD